MLNLGILPAITIRYFRRHIQSLWKRSISFQSQCFQTLRIIKNEADLPGMSYLLKSNFDTVTGCFVLPFTTTDMSTVSSNVITIRNEARGFCYLCVHIDYGKQLHTTKCKILHRAKVIDNR